MDSYIPLSAIPFGSTFLIVGSGQIDKYVPSDNTWELITKLFGSPVDRQATMIVNLEMFPTCDAKTSAMTTTTTTTSTTTTTTSITTETTLPTTGMHEKLLR